MKLVDLSGLSFGNLTVLSRSGSNAAGATWLCSCSCGANCVVSSGKLKSGHTQSCGCLRKIGYHRTHNGSGTQTHRSWKEMRQRCLNKNSDKWRWYGGRGISICDRWSLFENFLEDMGERPEGMTLDRIDNDGPYSPDNCRWLPQIEQTRRQEKNKLSLELADSLREDRKAGMSFRALGDKYGVSSTTAHRACIGETWSK